ncbi:MAG: hypothetical protein ABDH25_05895 [Dictyoglomaceae bacterium]
MKIAVQFGAGNIGRGFIADLLKRSGYKIVFVESNKELVDALNKRGNYPLKLFQKDGNIKDLIIDDFYVLSSSEEEKIAQYVSQGEVIFTAVGVKNLSDIALPISQGLKKRFYKNPSPLNIFICENSKSAPEILKKEIFKYLNQEEKNFVEKKVGFVLTSVARMVAGSGERYGYEDPLLIVTEEYNLLPFDLRALKGNIPPILGLKPSGNFELEIDKKLFIHNLGHSALAYFGYLKGYKFIHESIKDKEVREVFDGVIKEVSQALFLKHKDIDKREYKEYLEDLIKRFENSLLMDPITRVARDPIRKLDPSDRIIGGARLCLSQGIFPENIAFICASVFFYDYPEDKEAKILQEKIKESRIDYVLMEICGLSLEEDFTKKVIFYYEEINKNLKGVML